MYIKIFFILEATRGVPNPDIRARANDPSGNKVIVTPARSVFNSICVLCFAFTKN